MISVHHTNTRRPFGSSFVKSIVVMIAAAALTSVAGAAFAQSQPAAVTVSGTATAICSLPTSFAILSSTGGQTGTFNGTTWLIPTSAIAGTDGQAVVGDEVAIRLSGEGFCNTSHRIYVESESGALRREGAAATAPTGFAIARRVKYDAHWANRSAQSQGRRFGPGVFDFVPDQPFAAKGQDWRPGLNATGVPGARPFDVRLAVLRESTGNQPLVAGTYSDTVIVSLTPLS